VVHLASLLSGQSEQDRERGWRVNVDGGFALFEAALAAGVRQVFFASSLAVYGGRLPDPVPEDFPEWPQGLYGVTKVACERLGVYYHERHGLDFRCLRLPIVLSRFAPPGAASAYASRAFIDAVGSGRVTLKVNPRTRAAMIYVKDALEAIASLLWAPADKLTRRVYNINAVAPSARELVEAIAARVEPLAAEFAPDPPTAALIESWPAVLVDRSARQDWQWRPRYDLDRLADDFLEELRRDVADAPRLRPPH
jgi:threonine 3-dehydrogenase